MLVYIDNNGYLRGLGARIDENIGVLFTDGTKAKEITRGDVLSLSLVGDGVYADSYGRRLFETESSYLGNGTGGSSISTRGSSVVKIGYTEINYMGNKVTKIGGVELHYFGDKLSKIGNVELHYRGDIVTSIGRIELSYVGERVTKFGGRYI